MPSPNKHRTRAVKYDKVAHRAHIKIKYLGLLELLYGHRKYKRASKAIERGAACGIEQQTQTSCLPVGSRLAPPKFSLGKSFPLYNHLSYSSLDLLLIPVATRTLHRDTCKVTNPVLLRSNQSTKFFLYVRTDKNVRPCVFASIIIRQHRSHILATRTHFHHIPTHSNGYNRTEFTHSRPLNMNRYDVREELGDGTFGTVFRAINRDTHEEVRSVLFA
jgi:hypothetical protein